MGQNRKFGEGFLGLKGGPADDPCHKRFAGELRMAFSSYGACHTDFSSVRVVLEYVYREPISYRGPKYAYWMLLTVQGLTAELIPLWGAEDAESLAQSYNRMYSRRVRLPNQKQLFDLLRKAAGETGQQI